MDRNSYEDLSLQEMGDRATTPTYWKTEEEWLTKHHPSALLNDDENGEEENCTANSLIAKLKKQLKTEGKQLVVFFGLRRNVIADCISAGKSIHVGRN